MILEKRVGITFKLGGEGGSEILPETKIKMSASKKEKMGGYSIEILQLPKINYKEYREESSIRSKKMWENEEFRNKMTKENHWNYGKHLSNETKEKIENHKLEKLTIIIKVRLIRKRLEKWLEKTLLTTKRYLLDTGETFISTTDAIEN